MKLMIITFGDLEISSEKILKKGKLIFSKKRKFEKKTKGTRIEIIRVKTKFDYEDFWIKCKTWKEAYENNDKKNNENKKGNIGVIKISGKFGKQ